MSLLAVPSLALGFFNGYHDRHSLSAMAGYLGVITPVSLLTRLSDVMEKNVERVNPTPLPRLIFAGALALGFVHGGLICVGNYVGKAARKTPDSSKSTE